MLVKNGGGDWIKEKSFDVCVTIPKQQETVAGFANKFGISAYVIANSLH